MPVNKRKATVKKNIAAKEDVQTSNDKHIDQDFPGYPHNPSKEKMINPETKNDRLISNTDEKPVHTNEKPIFRQEHTTTKTKKRKTEVTHAGSGGAFEGTEEVKE